MYLCLFSADQVYGDQEMHSIVRKHCMDYMVKNFPKHLCHYNHRQSKEWTGNADHSANIADASSVILPDTLCFRTL